jgi:hypothetical protein
MYFTVETCSSDFDETRYRAFLKDKGVFGEGCWSREGSLPMDEVQAYRYGKNITDISLIHVQGWIPLRMKPY